MKALDYLHHSALNAEALSNPRLISTTNIIQNFQNPKIEAKNSLITPEMDASYLKAVKRGDMATSQRMVMWVCHRYQSGLSRPLFCWWGSRMVNHAKKRWCPAVEHHLLFTTEVESITQ
jgi:hypothetical protein